MYAWTSGSESGTKTAEILEIKELSGVRYYVMRIGDIDHYYTLSLQWAGSVRDSKVETRMVPPEPWFIWPLAVGRRWEFHGLFEERNGKKRHDDVFAVVGDGTVEVPAGRFYALKVVREGARRETDEYWYAPEVRWYAKWIGRRGEVQFEERLQEYHRAPRLVPESGPDIRPSK